MEGIQGVIFRRSIRASYATLDLEVCSSYQDATQRHVIVLIQFSFLTKKHEDNKSEATQCRSYFRRSFKLGDEVEIIGGKWLDEKGNAAAAYRKLEVVGFVVQSDSPSSLRCSSPNANAADVRLVRRHVWDNTRCQEARARYYPPSTTTSGALASDEEVEEKQQTKRRKRDKTANSSAAGLGDDGENEIKTLRHGGGIGKRKQGEVIAAFLIERVASTKFNGSREKTIAYLNNGTGCVDAAGGSGHVSLALSLKGITSTVVDPRPSVGRLPKRDRKALRMAIKRHKEKSEENTGSGILHPPVQFKTFRAWFASRPDGVDLTYREGTRGQNDARDRESALDANESTEAVPICHMCSSDKLLPSCSAIIALHPDEATGLIVEHAVKHKIPFFLVPCCVFSRIFSNRYKANGQLVQTYDDLIEWLRSKDTSIRVDTLPFDGANKVLWSTFTN